MVSNLVEWAPLNMTISVQSWISGHVLKYFPESAIHLQVSVKIIESTLYETLL